MRYIGIVQKYCKKRKRLFSGQDSYQVLWTTLSSRTLTEFMHAAGQQVVEYRYYGLKSSHANTRFRLHIVLRSVLHRTAPGQGLGDSDQMPSESYRLYLQITSMRSILATRSGESCVLRPSPERSSPAFAHPSNTASEKAYRLRIIFWSLCTIKTNTKRMFNCKPLSMISGSTCYRLLPPTQTRPLLEIKHLPLSAQAVLSNIGRWETVIHPVL